MPDLYRNDIMLLPLERKRGAKIAKEVKHLSTSCVLCAFFYYKYRKNRTKYT